MKYQIVPSIKWINGKVKSGFKVLGMDTSIGMFKNIADAKAFIKEINLSQRSRKFEDGVIDKRYRIGV